MNNSQVIWAYNFQKFRLNILICENSPSPVFLKCYFVGVENKKS